MNTDAIARIEEQVKALTHSTDKILTGIYGNGTKGLKERVKERKKEKEKINNGR